jgi:membrane protein YdbS with pleckstrin-like domain
MRCPQCGFEAAAGAVFCSRCGTRVFVTRPESRHEFALSRIMTSWWTYLGSFVVAALLILLAIAAQASRQSGGRQIALGLFVLALLIIISAIISRRATSWSITSERLIERRGFLSQTRLEVELVDIRSVEVTRTFSQRLLGIGTVVVVSAASADYLIRMLNIGNPDEVAETIRKARLRRLA